MLKVLDAAGHGRISDVIAALDYVVANKTALKIRVVNLSVATGVYESYETDPLTLAAQRAVAEGVVVVAAAGNYGHDQQGRKMYGGVTAPGNAPWVLTVGASSHMGTADRADDRMATFSSRGPTAIDHRAKPDLVAPGVGIESLSDPKSTFYTTQAPYLLEGTVPTSYLPYLSQSGTSMSAPVVSGAVALMLQANPSLTPNQVKAILQFSAEVNPRYDPLTEGAGFLNAKGAVDLALNFGSGAVVASPDSSRRIIWGNRLLSGGRLTPEANAWRADVTWGSRTTPAGQEIEWGVRCADTGCEDGESVWRAGPFRNVVWGSRCGGDDCDGSWSLGLFGASDDDDTVVWGTSDDDDTVVWGTSDDETRSSGARVAPTRAVLRSSGTRREPVCLPGFPGDHLSLSRAQREKPPTSRARLQADWRGGLCPGRPGCMSPRYWRRAGRHSPRSSPRHFRSRRCWCS